MIAKKGGPTKKEISGRRKKKANRIPPKKEEGERKIIDS